MSCIAAEVYLPVRFFCTDSLFVGIFEIVDELDSALWVMLTAVFYHLFLFCQTKDRALVHLETDNQRLKAEIQGLREDLAVQEEELAYQQRELQQLRQHGHQQDTLPHQQGYPEKGEYLMMLQTYTVPLYFHVLYSPHATSTPMT